MHGAVVRAATGAVAGVAPDGAGAGVVVIESAQGAYLAVRPRTDLQTESWRLLREEWAADPAAQAEWEEWERRRARVRPQMVALLERFLGGAIGLEHFRTTFDRRTRTDWDAFALKGSSGAMFLNTLAKHAAHPVTLARRLRAALRAPSEVAAAGPRLDALIAAVAPPTLLGDAAEGDGDPLAELPRSQPLRTVFFASMCWHLQDPDRWPGFQPSARQVLRDEEELFTPSGDPVRDYLRFRESFLSLAAGLSLTVWQLEHLCWWHARRAGGDDENVRLLGDRPERRVRDGARRSPHRAHPTRPEHAPRVAPHAVRETPPPYVPFTEPAAPDHTHVQWLLAKLGQQLGCRVWIAANDQRRRWGDEPLGSLSVPRLPPLGMDPDSQRAVSLIDVVWLTGTSQVAAAFEVEHTTSVYSGLLRMADLTALSPNLNFPLYVVAPAARLAKVRRELARPTFRTLGLDRRCRFFSSEALLRALPSLARWGSGPEAIAKIAERLEAADE